MNPGTDLFIANVLERVGDNSDAHVVEVGGGNRKHRRSKLLTILVNFLDCGVSGSGNDYGYAGKWGRGGGVGRGGAGQGGAVVNGKQRSLQAS